MKNIVLIFNLILIIIILSSCESTSNAVSSSIVSSTEAYTAYSEPAEVSSLEIEYRSLNLKERITHYTVLEIEFTHSEWTKKIEPSNTSGYYTYRESDKGEIYFVVWGKIKNLAETNINPDKIHDSYALVNNKYRSSVYFDAEDSNGDSFHGTVKPLQELNFFMYTIISDELFSNLETISIYTKILSYPTPSLIFVERYTFYLQYVLDFVK